MSLCVHVCALCDEYVRSAEVGAGEEGVLLP